MLRQSWIEVIGIGILFFILTTILYWPARDAGFTSDFTAHLEMFEEKRDEGWINSFGWRSNQPVLFGSMFLWYQFFGLSPIPWFFLFVTGHCINALLLFVLVSRLITRGSSTANPFFPALICAILFLLHPYQVEVVVWKVCLHYLISTFCLLGMLNLLVQNRVTRSIGFWILFHSLFFIALFALELAFTFPLIIAFTVIWIAWEEKWPRPEILKVLGNVLIPQVLIMGVYFVWNQIRLNAWIGHYGEEVHMRLSLDELISHTLNYFLKYLLFTRDWGHAWKGYLGEWPLRDPTTLYLAAFVSLLLVIGLVWWSLYQNRLFRTALWGLLLFFLALGPVISLYFAWIGLSENDRYGYLASAFFVMALVLFLWRCPRPVFFAITAFLIILQISLLRHHIDQWRQGQRAFSALLSDYRWQHNPDVYILGMPDNYNGFMLFRGFEPGDGIRDALHYVGGKNPSGKLTEVAAFVMMDPRDGIRVNQLDSLSYNVSFNQWGNWFVRKGLGAGDYMEEGYQVDFHEGGYTMTFDQMNAGRTLVFSDGGRWKVVGH